MLFVCTHNAAGRKWLRRCLSATPVDVRAESAGQQPADRVWPEVVEVMDEIGIDQSDRRPKKLTVEMQPHADWAITLACGAQCPYVPTTVEDWGHPRPGREAQAEEVESAAKAADSTSRTPRLRAGNRTLGWAAHSRLRRTPRDEHPETNS